MPYIPNEKQVIAHTAEARFVGYGGAMGGGKTRWLCEAAKLLSMLHPGNFGLIARQSGPALRLSTLEVFMTETLIPGTEEWKQLGCKWRKSEGILEFTALDPPSKIWFTGLDSDNVERCKSLNLGFFGLDEATEIAESIYLMLCTRLRRKHIPSSHRKGMITANPEAGWVKRRFLDQTLKDHIFIQANYKDNPHLPDDYHELFATMPATWREKYLEGNWGAVSGLVWKEFNPERHIIPFRVLPPEWNYVRGLDHGQQNPCACLGMAYGYPDKLELDNILGQERIDTMHKAYNNYPVIIADRLYHSPGLVGDHRKVIYDTFKDKLLASIPTYGDPSMWRKDRSRKIVGKAGRTKEVPYSIADEYLEEPNPLAGLIKGNNIVDVGVNRVATLLNIGHLYFMDHPSLDPLIGEAGEIRSYAWKQPRTDDMDWPEEIDKRRDHACDALRYAVMSLPPINVIESKVIPYNSFMEVRKRAIEDKKGKFTVFNGRVRSLR